MRPPRSFATRRSASQQSRRRIKAHPLQLELLMQLMDLLDALDHDTRAPLVRRKRRAWSDYIRPMLADRTFRLHFRMEYEDFMYLVTWLRPALERDQKMGNLRNGAISVERQVAMGVRWLAGASVFELMDTHVIARSTAYAIVQRVINAINKLINSCLDCVWPWDDAVERAAAGFQDHSSNAIVSRPIGAMNGLFIRLRRSLLRDHPLRRRFNLVHWKGFDMNFQAMRVRGYQSGGVGTDNMDEDDRDERGEIEDEVNGQENVDKADEELGKAVLAKAERESLKNKKDAIHTRSFCKGKAPLMIWNDILQTFGEGDNGPVGDSVNADNGSGSVSRVPGGAGVKSMTGGGGRKRSGSGGAGAGSGATGSRIPRTIAANAAKKAAYVGLAAVMAKWQESVDAERLASAPTIEDLADTILRLQGKLNTLAANAHALVRAGFTRALDKAVAELTARLGM